MKLKRGVVWMLTGMLCCLWLGCVKEETKTLRIPNNLRRDWNFGVGSYWIYLDEVSGRVDSCFVVSYSDTVEELVNISSKNEHIIMQLRCVHLDNDSDIVEYSFGLQYQTTPSSIYGLNGYLKFPLDHYAKQDTGYLGPPCFRGELSFNANGTSYANTLLCVNDRDSTYMKLGVGVVAEYRHEPFGYDSVNRRYTLLRYSIRTP